MSQDADVREQGRREGFWEGFLLMFLASIAMLLFSIATMSPRDDTWQGVGTYVRNEFNDSNGHYLITRCPKHRDYHAVKVPSIVGRRDVSLPDLWAWRSGRELTATWVEKEVVLWNEEAVKLKVLTTYHYPA